MVKQFIVFCLICCALLSPVFGVSRLFIDEITGYTNEAVRATNVNTDLLVVDEQTVENAVTADAGDDNHVVDTSGKITLSGRELDFTASDSIEITSLGENVGFQGSEVNFSSTKDITIDGVDTSILANGDITGFIGGEFSTFGTDAEIRSVFDMSFNAGQHVKFIATDQVQFTSDTIDINAVNDVLIDSEESNIFIDSLVNIAFNSVRDTTITADSGLEIGSSHGEASFSVDTNINVLAENFIYTTETNTFAVNNSLTLETQSIAGDIFMYTERSYFTNPNGPIVMESIGENSQTAVLTSGTIESMSDTLTSSSKDILILSVDGTTLTARNNVEMTAVNEISYLASGGMLFAGSNTFLESSNGEFEMDAFGKAFFNSRGQDVLINTADTFMFNTGSTSVSADNTMQLNSNAFDATGDFIDFYSFRDINVNTPRFTVAADSARFDSHEGTTIRQQSASFTSETTLSVQSTGDIRMQNSVDFTQTADNATYFATRQATINAIDTTVNSDLISFQTGDDIHTRSGGAVNFNINDEATFTGENMNVIADNDILLDVNVDVGFEASSAGGFSFESSDVSISSPTFTINSNGNVAFTTGSISFDSTDLAVDGNDIIISATEAINLDGDGDLDFNSLSTFVYLPASFSAGDFGVTGGSGVSIGAGQSNGDSASVFADNFMSTHKSVDIQGGSITFNTNTLELGQDNPDVQDIEFSVSRERDLQVNSSNDIAFDAQNSDVFSSNLHFESENEISLAADGILLTGTDRVAIFADDDIAFESRFESISVDNFASAVFNTEDDLLIGASSGDFIAETVIDFFASDNAIFASGGDLTVLTRNIHAYNDDGWIIDAGEDVKVRAGEQLSLFFEEIAFDMEDIEVDADRIETNSITETTFNTNNDFLATAQDVTIQGGTITLTASSSVTIASLSEVIIGSTAATPSDPVYEDVNFELGSFTQTAGELLSFIATSTEKFEKHAISMQATSFDVDAANIITDAFRGVVVNTPVFTSTSQAATDFVTQEGAMSVLARASGSFIQFITTNDMEFEAQQGKMFISAGDDISSLSGSLKLTAGKHINMETTGNNIAANANIDFESVEEMSFTGSALSIDAGVNGQTTADITFNVAGDSEYTFGDDVRMRALGNQLGSSEEILLSGGFSDSDSTYLVSATEQITFYPSGLFTLNADAQGTFTAGNEDEISFGTVSNEFSLDVDDGFIEFISAEDFSVKAGGVSGDILGEIEEDFSMTVTGEFFGSANGTAALLGGFFDVDAADDVSFFALNHDQGNIHISGGDLSFTTEADPIISEIELIGKNTRTYADDTIILSPVIKFGQQNQITPRVTAEVDSWLIDSIGDIVIGAENDEIRHVALDEFEVAAGSVVMTSGGDIIFEANDELGESDLTLTSDSFTTTAFEFVETHSGRIGGEVTFGDDVTLISVGKNTGNGIFINTDNNIEVDGDDITQNIVTSATMNTESGKITTNTFVSDSQTLLFDVDHRLSFSATRDFIAMTTGKTAKIEVVAEGVNGDIEFGVDAFDIDSSEDVVIRAAAFESSSNDLLIDANGQNSGKITFDASNDVVFQVDGDVDFVGADGFFFESIGPESTLEMSANDLTVDSDREISYENNAGEGGSIFFLSESQEADLAFDAEDWEIDVDGDFVVNTLGTFTFSGDGNFELAAGGWLDVAADENIRYSAGIGDIHFEAENADVFAYSAQTTQFRAGNDLFSQTQTIDVTVRGNDTSSTVDELTFQSGGDIEFSEEDGDLLISTYNQFTITAASYIQFEAQTTDLTDEGLFIQTTSAAGDFVAETPNGYIIGEDVELFATGTAPESGFVKFIADRDGYYSTGASIGGVTISSSDETIVEAQTGDINFEYASKLLIFGGNINGIANRAIEFNVRGDGRTLHSIQDSDATVETLGGSIVFNTLSGVQFITENGGDIVVESGASDVYVNTQIMTARSDIENFYLESTGTVSIISRRSDPFTAIDFDSTGDILFTAYDDNINLRASFLFMTTPNVEATMLWEVEQNSLLDIHTSGDMQFTIEDEGDISFFHSSGADINFTASTDDVVIFGSDSVTFVSQKAIYVPYHGTAVFLFDTMTVEANLSYYFDEAVLYEEERGIVRLSGRNRIIDSEGDSAANQVRPIVAFPDKLSFDQQAIRVSVEKGGYCEWNRSIGFGETNTDIPILSTIEEVLCVCVDHVWLCAFDEIVSGIGDDYYYDRYNALPRDF